MGYSAPWEISGEERARLGGLLPAYELEGVIGSGAFGVVYAARHRHLERDVAIKRLSSGVVLDSDASERFAVEARLLASLDHPHVLRVYDYVDRDGICALVMERMRGGTLADRTRLGRLAAAKACAIMIGVLSGLEHAHQHGVLHRDIKPENLLFGSGDLIKVADFGIAKVVGAAGARLTATAGTLGTPAYMAPEQVRRAAGALSPATDVWAAGAVLYELLAGDSPYPRGAESDLGDVLLQRVSEDPRPLRDAAPEVPAAIEAVVMRALAREPDRRWQTAAEFATALDAAVDDGLGRGALAATRVPIHRTEPGPIGGTTIVGEDLQPTLLPQGRTRRRTRPTLPVTPRARRTAAGALLALALLVAVAIVALESGGRHRVAAASAGGGSPVALADLPKPPLGWPAKMPIGPVDSVRTAAQFARYFGRGSIAYTVLAGDPKAKMDWSHAPGPSPKQFAMSAHAAGLLPYFELYELRALGLKGGDADTRRLKITLANAPLMRIYWANVTKLLKQLGQSGGPVVLNTDITSMPLLEQDNVFSAGQPSDIAVRVSSLGIPEFKGLSDDLPGFAAAWLALRQKYAPNVNLAVETEFYGTNLDLAKTHPNYKTLINEASNQGRWILSAGFGAGYMITFGNPYAEQGKDPNAAYPTDADKALWIDWIRQFVKVATVPVMLTGVPPGNTIMKTINDKPFHYHDHWTQWLIGDASFTNLRKLRDAGVIGIVFSGAGSPDFTCPCDAAHDGVTNGGRTGMVATSSDDDGGYTWMRMKALRDAGGLPLR